MTNYIDMYYKPSAGDKTTKRQYVEIRRSRVRYGLHVTDTWSLDRYLAIVISNSLKMLADNAHAFPGSGIYEGEDGYDKWIADLNYHAESFKIYTELDKREWEYHEEIEWPKHDFDDYFDESDGHCYAVFPEDEEEPMRQWQAKIDADHKATMLRVNESFDWLKEWWCALWD